MSYSAAFCFFRCLFLILRSCLFRIFLSVARASPCVQRVVSLLLKREFSERITADQAAAMMHLILWAPTCWLQTPRYRPDACDVSRWKIVILNKCEWPPYIHTCTHARARTDARTHARARTRTHNTHARTCTCTRKQLNNVCAYQRRVQVWYPKRH